VNTPMNENEGLRTLRQLGREISQLWEVVEREGGVMVSATQATKMMELHQAVAGKFLGKPDSVERRLEAIEKQVTTIAKRLPAGAGQPASGLRSPRPPHPRQASEARWHQTEVTILLSALPKRESTGTNPCGGA
jgi:hypothetical protein